MSGGSVSGILMSGSTSGFVGAIVGYMRIYLAFIGGLTNGLKVVIAAKPSALHCVLSAAVVVDKPIIEKY